MTITLTCLALAAYMESREHYTQPDAMAAVVAVVMNRVDDPRWPDTACDVIASGAFPWYTTAEPPSPTAAPDQWAWNVAQVVALNEMAGVGLDIPSTHFRTEGAPQYWEGEYEFDGCIGGNCYFTNETPYP